MADIGTDHGYIPVWLAQTGTARRIIASDIKNGPLENARTSARSYGVEDQIEFIKADGLSGIRPHQADTVILAGMGGETIQVILERAVWTREGGVHCIVQPQSKCDELAFWLRNNGYCIDDAKMTGDDGRLYIVWSVLAGTWRETPLQVLFRKRDVLLTEFLNRLIIKKKRAVDGLIKSSGNNEQELHRQRMALEALKHMKKETDKWPR